MMESVEMALILHSLQKQVSWLTTISIHTTKSMIYPSRRDILRDIKEQERTPDVHCLCE